ncbi:hypothetical protein [Nonomuraea sp. NPDC049028]|uniref:hypothetical protein n=1 Tax=Nonomuraea sp. NPDC049028 TaxID=3364348 RepID=UPI003715A368
MVDGSREEIQRRAEARITRQQLLIQDMPPEVTVILGRGHPAEARITIYLIPFGAGGHTGLDGEFTVLDLPDEEDPPRRPSRGAHPLSLYVMAAPRISDGRPFRCGVV